MLIGLPGSKARLYGKGGDAGGLKQLAWYTREPGGKFSDDITSVNRCDAPTPS